MFTVPANFIGNFKIGDNINYNLKILEKLYSCRADLKVHEQKLLNKPIILLLVAITEAALYDFINVRAKLLTSEGITGVAAAVLADMRSKDLSDFSKFIASFRKHDLFDKGEDKAIYDMLDRLRILRNRIHIQNTKGAVDEAERNESKVFTPGALTNAEEILEFVFRFFASKYPRPEKFSSFVSAFPCPWNSHHPTMA